LLIYWQSFEENQIIPYLLTVNLPCDSHRSLTNRCTFLRTFIKIYIKIRWLLHVSVYDHHQGACNWAWL